MGLWTSPMGIDRIVAALALTNQKTIRDVVLFSNASWGTKQKDETMETVGILGVGWWIVPIVNEGQHEQ